jgi:hypothetical protein
LSDVFGSPLLVSIPGAQLTGLTLPGAVFRWRDLSDALLPPDLRLALGLVVRMAAASRLKLRFVARPEIHTHGVARAWLDARIEGARDHLILTDGTTLRMLPGLANHLFFYPRGNPLRDVALQRLVGVVPELFAGLASQVNGGLAFRLGSRWVRPPLRSLRFAATPPLEAPMFAPFFLHPGDPVQAATLCAEAAAEPADAPPDARPVHHIPLSAAALADRDFLHALARRAQRAALGGTEELLVLGLPFAESAGAELDARIAEVLRTLVGTGVPFPRNLTWDVRFATAPPEPAAFAGGTLTLHPGTAFWRFGTDLYAAAGRVQVAGGASLAPFRTLLCDWLGREVAVLRPRANGPPVMIGGAS